MLGPKIYIEDEIPGTEPSLRTQELAYMKVIPDLDDIGRQMERGHITPQFIMSTTFEDHFKPMIDQVCRKYVLNGYLLLLIFLTSRDTPLMQNIAKDQQLKDKVVKWYRIFHFGEEISDFERFIERSYLTKKMAKY